VPSGSSESPSQNLAGLVTGSWTISEDPLIPAPAGWTWTPIGVECVDRTGAKLTAAGGSITVPLGTSGQDCVFTNEIAPTGSLTIDVTTLGGTGTFGATIIGGSSPQPLHQSATTVTPGVAVAATGDSTDPLGGQWYVVPTAPVDTSAGHWMLTSSPTCNAPAQYATNIGKEQLRVHPSNPVVPHIVCSYIYSFVKASTLQVTKVVTGVAADRSGPIVLDVSCADGSSASLTVPAASSGPVSLSSPLSFTADTECQVVETSSGVAPGGAVAVTSAVTINGQPVSADPANFLVPADAASNDVVVTLTDRYEGAALAATGTDLEAPLVLGLSTLLLGAGLLVGARRRRRTA